MKKLGSPSVGSLVNRLPLPLVEVAERSEDGECLPLPLGEVAEQGEDGEGRNDHTKR